MTDSIYNIAFDIFIGIDWSGAISPIRSHALSLSWCPNGRVAPHCLERPISRRDIANWIIEKVSNGHRMFIGIDCNLGYSAHIIAKQFGLKATARDLWQKVDTLNYNDGNFSSELFWKSPQYMHYFWSSGKSPDWYDQRYLRRLTETECISQGLGKPECPFKLIGPKQVGKGGLSGMRLAIFLSEMLRDKISIWPFQNITDSTQVIMSEIYPRLFWNRTGMRNIKVRDVDTLNDALSYFKSQPVSRNTVYTDHDTDAIITAVALRNDIQSKYAEKHRLFDIPDHIQPIVKSEGWIFGVNTQRVPA